MAPSPSSSTLEGEVVGDFSFVLLVGDYSADLLRSSDFLAGTNKTTVIHFYDGS